MGNESLKIKQTVIGMINGQGSKGNCVFSDGDKCFTLNRMHGFDMHVVFVKQEVDDGKLK